MSIAVTIKNQSIRVTLKNDFVRISFLETNTLQTINASSGGGTWGSITGTLSNQTDLQNALNAKLATGLARLLTGTNTFTGAVTDVGTTTNTYKYQVASLGVTTTNVFMLENTSTALTGAQQIYPPFVQRGRGHATNAGGSSQTVDFYQYVLPVQGAANPSGIWNLASSINGGALTTLLSVMSAGEVDITGVVRSIDLSNSANFNASINSTDGGAYWSSAGISNSIFLGGANYERVATVYRAKTTSASAMIQNVGTIGFYTNTGLTGGNTFAPTERMMISSAGIAVTGAITATTSITAATTMTSLSIAGSSNGNIGLATSTWGTSAVRVVALADGTAPSTSPANLIQYYSESGILKYRDSSGNIITV